MNNVRAAIKVAFTPRAHRSAFLGIFYAFLITVMLRYLHHYANTPAESGLLTLKIAAMSVVTGLTVFLISAAFNRFRRWSVANWPSYLAEVAILSLAISVERASYAIIQFPLPQIRELTQPQLQSFLFNMLTIVVLGAILNVLQQQLITQLTDAEKQARELRERQRALVFSDEQIKEQVSQFLHNRVQSDLMVTALKLKDLGKELPAETAAKVQDLVKDIERLRAFDIRGLSQSLGPQLSSQSLETSIYVLISQYQGQLAATVDLKNVALQERGGNHGQLQLGIYRIVEQALLNAVAHGQAKNVEISLASIGAREAVLVVADDGQGSVGAVQAGMGTSIIDAWVDILSGTKRVVSAPGAGYRLEVQLPMGRGKPQRKK